MKRLLAVAVLLVWVFAGNIQAATYEDGQTHDIDYLLNDSVYILNHNYNIDEPTTVNLLTGGIVNGVDVYDSSVFNLFDGGTVNYEIYAYWQSRVNISGGTASGVIAGDYSHVTMTGGHVNHIMSQLAKHCRCYRRNDWIFGCW